MSSILVNTRKATAKELSLMRVLLMGEYKPMLRALRRGLEEDGFAVEISDRDREEGEAVPLDFDVIVLDQTRPGAAGLGPLRRWRRAGLRTPVFVLTAPTADGDAEVLDAEAADWLVKPFDLEEFLARLRALARRGA